MIALPGKNILKKHVFCFLLIQFMELIRLFFKIKKKPGTLITWAYL